MNRRQPSLIFCIAMDLIGMSSYALPFLGEAFDVIWAPISAVIFAVTFGGVKGVLGGIGNLFEELLPGTDFIPSFTLMWLSQRTKNREETQNSVPQKARLFQ